MPLNLGEFTTNESNIDLNDITDLYIDCLENDQALTNLENAIEIAEQAQNSGSAECVAFAEQLLGASCEVILSNAKKEYARVSKNSLGNARLRKSLVSKILSYARTACNKGLGNRSVTIGGALKLYFDIINPKVKDLVTERAKAKFQKILDKTDVNAKRVLDEAQSNSEFSDMAKRMKSMGLDSDLDDVSGLSKQTYKLFREDSVSLVRELHKLMIQLSRLVK